jgi:phage shock protein PspC (stress-responsive transcriptional regulator)
MKKTITVNLNGRVFTIDEDAYRLLDNYLNNLRIYFRKEEGASEIIADFEARIEELLSEKIRLGYQVITIEQVEEVIARVGKPTDFADREDAEEEKKTNFTEPAEVKRKFYRNIDDKMFGGVCSGIAACFNWDVLPVRIIFIILLFATQLIIVPVYLFVWLIVPAARTAEQKLQMRGKPITVENIGKAVAAEMEPHTSAESKGCLAGFIDVFVALLKVFLIALGLLIAMPLVVVLFVLLVLLIAALFGVGGGLLGILPSIFIVDHPVLATTAFLMVAGIPLASLIYAIIAYFAKWKPLNRVVKWIFLLVWIFALILMLSSGFRLGINKNFWNGNWNVKNWNLGYDSNRHSIRGNGILSEKIYVLDGPVTQIETSGNLFSNLQIEQVQADSASIFISGDENLIDQVKYDLHEGRLILSSSNSLRSENNLVIRLRTGDLKSIRSDALGNIQMNRAFTGDELEIKMNGPARFSADSLYVRSLTVNSEGIASVNLSGKANIARLNLAGAGQIDAFDLLSDTVYAAVKGIGAIQCNPAEYFEGKLQGIGKITYKDEPKVKNVTSEGIGKIGRE